MLLENLRRNYAILSKSHQKLADYLADNYRQVAFMTSSQLASEVGVNGATVTRFAQKLGYPGYPELIADLRAFVQGELIPDQADTSPHEPDVRLALRIIGNSIERMSHQLDSSALLQAREMLTSAPRVVILAQGSAAVLGALLAEFLRLRGISAGMPSGDPYALAVAVADASPELLVIGLGILNESQEVTAALRYANQQNAPTLAIASSPTNPVVQAAHLAISWLADESNPVLTMTEAANLIAALVLTPPVASASSAENEQRLAGALDVVLGRRRRTN